MRRLFVVAATALLFLTAPLNAQTVKTKTQLYSDITTNFPNNATGFITPLRLRNVLNDTIASFQQYTSVNAQTGTTYTILSSDQGKLVTFTNAAPVAVTLPAGATLGAGWSAFLKNNGAGAVTITPASGTIGGAASLSINTGQGVFIDSDGANWQTWGGTGTGTVTSITCGSGLDGGTITLSGTCSLTSPVSMSNGGTSASLVPTAGGVVYTSSTAMAVLSNTASSQRMLQSGTSAPAWSTSTWPATTTANQILYSPTTNNVSGLTAVNSGVLITNASSVPRFDTLSVLMDGSLCGSRGSLVYRGAGTWVCLTAGTSGQVLSTGGTTADPSWISVAGTGTVTSVTCNNGLTGGTFTTSGTCAVDIATASNFFSGTTSKILDAATVFSTETAVTYGATPTFDFSTFINARMTLTGNITSMTCSNIKAGQAGTIAFIQDSTGSRLVFGFCSQFKWAGAVTGGTLSTSASAVDILSYSCRSTTYCAAALSKGYNP